MLEEERDPGRDEQPVVVSQSYGVLSNAPWWLVSAGIHAVILLGATLVAMERLYAVDPGDLTVVVHQPPTALFTEILKTPENYAPGAPIKDDVTANVNNDRLFYDPTAKPSDHAESDDGEDFHKRKGEGEQFIGYIPGGGTSHVGRQPGLNPGTHESLGVGGGAGSSGRYGGRFGGRANLRPQGKGGGSPATEDAVRAALKWLAHHQGPDGGWGADSFGNQCMGGRCGGGGDPLYDTGVTGLSVLAFLGAGYIPMSKDEFPDPIDPKRTLKFGETVKRGIQWLIQHQDPEGCIGERGPKHLYNHSVAALALSEAYGMTATQAVRDPAQKAIDFLIAAQNPGKGWRYSSRSGDNDTSVTGWAVMALKSAELSELSFPKSAYEGALNWFNEATEQNGYYQVGYNARSTGKVYVPGKNEQFDHHPSMSAVAVMSRIFIQKNRREPALQAVGQLVSDLPEWKQNKVDFYYWYYASLALFQYDGPDGPVWLKWNEPMKNTIVPHQKGRADGCRSGSWDPDQDRWGFEGGRVYAAAINALTLEVYYRYANVFGGGGAKK
ncbi:MAG: terpene cyclase/mutase family protein [Planctomycetes bacterium]|nr:terpene cyclase/mutase family protein [Planctomycetota bacterium]